MHVAIHRHIATNRKYITYINVIIWHACVSASIPGQCGRVTGTDNNVVIHTYIDTDGHEGLFTEELISMQALDGPQQGETC